MENPDNNQDGLRSSLSNAPSFIETQFPVAKASMESYKERTAKQSQTLTGLGKWWGRKPLILVRAALLGLLMPASNKPEKDREIFLKILTMDEEGLLRRKNKPIPTARLVEELLKLPPSVQKRYFDARADGQQRAFRKLSKEEKDELQMLVFERMSYAEKITYCSRPEQIDGLSPEAWAEINDHLGTQASNLSELVQELGEKRFGHRPRVGDAFCGGGSIPFEAARLGCDVYGSDLNPVAALLTWADLNIVGGGKEVIERVESARKEIYNAVEKQVLEWGIEQNSLGWRADAYLYCVEVTDPESGWKVPLMPSLVIGKKTNTIARLVPDPHNCRYDIQILQGVSDAEMEAADLNVTDKDSRVYPPGFAHSTPIDIIRKGLRLWENDDVIPREGDVFQERLYCIRWIETVTDDDGKTHEIKHYRAPTQEDQKREEKVLSLLMERFDEWQQKGFIPSRKIEPGYNTDQPIRERGWTYWHHLFTPRQLLMLGLLSEHLEMIRSDPIAQIGCLLSLGKCADYCSKLCRWHPRTIGDKSEQTFSNQALNTLHTYASRTLLSLEAPWFSNISSVSNVIHGRAYVCDARAIAKHNDLWITDPPYADAINYEEVSEYFLAWYERVIKQVFSNWYTDSKRSLAVKGNTTDFRQSMVDCYRRLTEKMPENGMQLVMFTHQDAAVWADLSMILWAAGLRVSAAWTIATEISTALKEGNYVQGTVLLVLRKRTNNDPVFIDEINHEVETEVRRQLDSMVHLDDNSDPNFGDADYQLAAYAAALRVLTRQPIVEINPEKEILRERLPGEISEVEGLIRRAVKIACDHLIPKGLDSDLWKSLGPMERFYIKGLEVESHGEYRSGVYQELARGFGATEYDALLESGKANETRLKSASEFGKKMLGGYAASESFSDSLVRQCLFAIWLTEKNEETRTGLDYLHTELRDAYWSNREKIIGILEFLASLRNVATMEHWRKDSEAAALVAGAVRNDHV
ncbi:MAG: DUF1156 domain-containing protein [Chloroflexi bacterium]|nr:DUF1156 domain-containing protein [Chloroflexota bacterium]